MKYDNHEIMNPDAVVEPVNPLWNLGVNFEQWCKEHNVEPKSDDDVRILARAIRTGAKGDRLKEAIRRVKHPESYKAKQIRHEQNRKIKRSKNRYGNLER